MSNLLRKHRDDLLQKELEELEALETQRKEEEEVNTPIKGDAEEETFRKRYGDLRRHAAKEKERLEAEKAALQQELERASKKDTAFPKTEEEVLAWSKKYPDLYKIFETMIMKREKGAMENVAKDFEEVNKLKAELAKERSMKVLLGAHPDFPEIAQSEEFHAWLGTKSKAVQDIMYEDGADVNDAIDVVTMYKNLSGTKKTPEKKPRDSEAARAIPGKTRSAPTFEGEHIFSETDVHLMNEREYLKHEAEINKQIASGKFVYDRTGAAR